jgi:hypothetical protein
VSNAFNFTINFVGGTGASRAWRSARVVSTGGTCSRPSFPNQESYSDKCCKCRDVPEIYTPKQTLLSNPRCVVPYYEWQIFKTGATTNINPSSDNLATMPALTEELSNRPYRKG